MSGGKNPVWQLVEEFPELEGYVPLFEKYIQNEVKERLAVRNEQLKAEVQELQEALARKNAFLRQKVALIIELTDSVQKARMDWQGVCKELAECERSREFLIQENVELVVCIETMAQKCMLPEHVKEIMTFITESRKKWKTKLRA
jgi:hypothetical protein